MKFSDSSTGQPEADPSLAGSDAVLAREAGVPFQPPLAKDSGIDPFVDWLSLKEVVQMLCPVWPVRESPMAGEHWRL